MTRTADNQNRTKIVRSIALVALIIVMDLSGFAGLANQDRLEDVSDYRGTNSTDSDGDGVPDDEDDYPNDPYRVGPYQNEGIGHIILLSDGGGGGFNVDDVAITFVEIASNITNISYLTGFDNLSVQTNVTDQYLSQGALYSVENQDWWCQCTGTIGDLVNGTFGISDFGSSLPNAVIVGGLGAALRIDIIDPDTGLAETAARGIEMRLGDGDTASEGFTVEVYDHNGSILHNESFTTNGGAVNGGVNFSYWYPVGDSDGDGTPDIDDAFPLDPTEDSDFDGNGVGDNAQFAEFDLDGDGVWDEVVNMPGFMHGLANTSTTYDLAYFYLDGACAILNNGSMMCWGADHNGLRGDGNPGPVYEHAPVYAALPQNRMAVEVSIGMDQACVLLDNGSVACWGRGHPAGILDYQSHWYPYGWQLEEATTVPSLPNDAISISVGDGLSGEAHTCAIMENGSVYCWGANQHGQLGIGYVCDYGGANLSGNNCVSHQYLTWNGDQNATYHIGQATMMNLPIGRTAVGLNLIGSNTFVVLDNHSMICYGNDCGSEGNFSNYVYVDNGSKITASFDQRVLTSEGLVLDLDSFHRPILTPVGVNSYNNQAGVFSEADRLCASLKNGSVACNEIGTWVSGSGGLGTDSHWYSPPNNLSAGGAQSDHSKACVALSNGELQCWGFNGGPQHLGTGYLCLNGTNDQHNCDSSNYVMTARSILLPRPIMIGEMDLDGDGISKLLDRCPDGESNWKSNLTSDFDGDGCRDISEDDDDDGDGIIDIDSDCDGLGNNVDPDDDNDGIPDETDAFPYNPYEWSDMDGDGTGDNCDCDTDGDGINNDIDAFPTDPSAHTDTDGDGMPDTMSTPDFNSIPSNGLIGYWDFDDTSGNPVDSSDEAHTSTAHGDPSYGEEGHADTAIQFDGEGDYIEIDADDAFNVTNITISVWVKMGYVFDGTPDNMYAAGLVCRGNGFEEVWCIDLMPISNNGTAFRFWHRHSDLNWSYADILTTTPLDLEWNHVAVTYDGITSKIYLNGQLEGWTTTISGNLSSSNESVYIATRQNAQSGGFPINEINATIDEVRIYNRALSEAEITLLYQASYTLIEDLDDDNDGTLDTDDAFPLDPSEDTDTDGDGVGDNADDDADGDGYSDLMDAFPLDPSEWLDTDGDVIGDNTDTDDDNDGSLDIDDAFPLDPSEDTDTDGDGVGDNADDDDDGDGVSDAMDAFPLDPSEWLDTDGDGVGNNADTNDDNDGSLDIDDAFPLDPSEDSDTDGDGVGDNADDDADGDGEVDNETALSIGPLNPSNSLKLSLLINLIMVLLATLVISSRRSSSGLNLVGFEKMPEPQITTAVKDRKEVLEKYLSQGYSPELANTLADNEIRKD